MLADIPPPLFLLLHEGGWDEVLMVGVGLVVAYLVIMWTGRRNRDEDDDEDDLEDDEDAGEDTRNELADRLRSSRDDQPRSRS